MNDSERIRAWYLALTHRGGQEATRVVRYIGRRERAAWEKGYRDGFEAGTATAEWTPSKGLGPKTPAHQ